MLRKNSNEIISAIQQDTGVSNIEARAEFAVAAAVVKEHFESIDTKSEIQNGTKLVQEKGEVKTRVPWGVVYIDPDLSHTPLFNVVSALSTAVTAGNCVALRVT
jgi:aldehyde dehydrogenase (NAD+)